MIITGRIGKIFGTAGELFVRVETERVERFSAGSSIKLDNGKELTIERSREKKTGVYIIKFLNIDTIESAKTLINRDIVIEDDELYDAGDDRYYIHDLIGCSAFSENNELYGEIVDIYEMVANAVLEILYKDNLVLIPFISNIVIKVDMEQKKVILRDFEEFF